MHWERLLVVVPVVVVEATPRKLKLREHRGRYVVVAVEGWAAQGMVLT